MKRRNGAFANRCDQGVRAEEKTKQEISEIRDFIDFTDFHAVFV